MNSNEKQIERIEKMTFSSVFPHYVQKIEKKNRTIDELYEVLEWFTHFNKGDIDQAITEKWTFKDFFNRAKLNQNSHLITGSICGYKIEEIENPLMQNVRKLDKLVDELAKGKKMEKILR